MLCHHHHHRRHRHQHFAMLVCPLAELHGHHQVPKVLESKAMLELQHVLDEPDLDAFRAGRRANQERPVMNPYDQVPLKTLHRFDCEDPNQLQLHHLSREGKFSLQSSYLLLASSCSILFALF